VTREDFPLTRERQGKVVSMREIVTDLPGAQRNRQAHSKPRVDTSSRARKRTEVFVFGETPAITWWFRRSGCGLSWSSGLRTLFC